MGSQSDWFGSWPLLVPQKVKMDPKMGPKKTTVLNNKKRNLANTWQFRRVEAYTEICMAYRIFETCMPWFPLVPSGSLWFPLGPLVPWVPLVPSGTLWPPLVHPGPRVLSRPLWFPRCCSGSYESQWVPLVLPGLLWPHPWLSLNTLSPIWAPLGSSCLQLGRVGPLWAPLPRPLYSERF